MKANHSILWVLVALVAGAGLTYWLMKNSIPAISLMRSAEAPPAIESLILTARPTLRVFTTRVPWIGTVEARASVELTALTAGRILSIEARDQSRIKSGGRVARLGGPEIDGQRARLDADIESLKIQLAVARETLKRLKQSLKMQLATRNQVAAAEEAQLKIAVSLHETRLQLQIFENEISISAPIDGIFTNRRVSVGQDVRSGQIIGEIIDSSHLRIVASLFPPKGITLQDKQAAIRLDQNQILSGRIRHVLPQASRTGAQMVWIEGPQIDQHLRPGQTVAGSIVIRGPSGTLAVPEPAVVYGPEENAYIFVAKDGAYERRRVQLGPAQDGWVAILAGLEKNDSVVTQGAYELFYRQFNEQFQAQD